MKERLRDLCRRYGIDALYAFGSLGERAAAALRAGTRVARQGTSDLDLGVLLRPGCALDAQRRSALAGELEDLLGGPQVDLVVLSDADPYLALDIVRGERLAVLDKHHEAEYELFVLRRAGDLAPFERERRRLVLGEVRG